MSQFNEVKFVSFSVIAHALDLMSRNLLPSSRSWRFVPTLASKSLTVSSPGFFFIYFEIIFVDRKFDLIFNLCMWKPSWLSTGLKKILVSGENLNISVTRQVTTHYRCARLFLDSKFNSIYLYIYSHTSTILLITVLQLIYLKIWK